MKLISNKLSFFFILSITILSYSQHSFCIEIANVNIPNTIKSGNNSLTLNGTGIRTKFFFDIYIGSLYLKTKESNINKILNDTNAKQINLHFLYKEVTKEKLTTGWIDGFKNNNTDEIFKSLQSRLNKFNSFFMTLHKGDTVKLDFLTSNKTIVTINSDKKGEISGADFQTALLKVWLGSDPADYNLKDAMLGIIDN